MTLLEGVLLVAFVAAVVLLGVRELEWRCWSADIDDELAELERWRTEDRVRRALDGEAER